MADAFFSSALGKPNEYRARFSDKVGLVMQAKGTGGGDLWCRPQGSSGPYTAVYHTNPQIKQVLLDYDKVELGGG